MSPSCLFLFRSCFCLGPSDHFARTVEPFLPGRSLVVYGGAGGRPRGKEGLIFLWLVCCFYGIGEVRMEVCSRGRRLPRLLRNGFFRDLRLFRVNRGMPDSAPVVTMTARRKEMIKRVLTVVRHHRVLVPPFVCVRTRIRKRKTCLSRRATRTAFPALLRTVAHRLTHQRALCVRFSRVRGGVFNCQRFHHANCCPVT